MIKNKINGWTITLVVLFSCLLYVGMVLWGGFDRFTASLAKINFLQALTVMVLVTVGYLLRYIRWHYYVERLGYQVPHKANLRIFLASFLMAISPGKVGEAVKSYFLKKEFSIPATPTLSAFFCERFTDVTATVLLSAVGFLIYPHGGWAMGLIICLMLITLVVLQKENWVEQFIFDPAETFSSLESWVQRGREFYRTSGDLLSLRPLLIGTGFGIASWGLEGVCLYIVLEGMGVSTVSMVVAVFIFAASVLLGAASMLPGGIGGSEAIMVAMLIFFGSGRADAVSATVVIRLTTLWYGVLLGAIAWVLSLRELKKLETT